MLEPFVQYISNVGCCMKFLTCLNHYIQHATFSFGMLPIFYINGKMASSSSESEIRVKKSQKRILINPKKKLARGKEIIKKNEVMS